MSTSIAVEPDTFDATAARSQWIAKTIRHILSSVEGGCRVDDCHWNSEIREVFESPDSGGPPTLFRDVEASLTIEDQRLGHDDWRGVLYFHRGEWVDATDRYLLELDDGRSVKVMMLSATPGVPPAPAVATFRVEKWL